MYLRSIVSTDWKASKGEADNKGSRPLHQSYYFYEELYQLPSGRTPAVLASHAAAHLLLGHVDEAKADIEEAVQQGGESDGDVLAVGASLGMEGYAQYVYIPHSPRKKV